MILFDNVIHEIFKPHKKNFLTMNELNDDQLMENWLELIL